MCPSAPLSQPQAIDNHADDTKEDQHAVADDTDADLVQAIWQSLEDNRNLHNSSNKSQVLSRNDHGPSNMSGIDPLNLRPDSSAQHFDEACDFSRGDYLESNDLIDSESSSSCSVNTCNTSRNSEEYFIPGALLHELEAPGTPDSNPECFDSVALLRNLETPAATGTKPESFDSGGPFPNLETPAITDTNPEYIDSGALSGNLETPAATDTNPECFDSGALLRNLETAVITNTNRRNVDFLLSVAASRGSQRVCIQPPASGSIGNYSNDMHRDVEDTADSATMMSMQRKEGSNPTHSTASVVEERSNMMPSRRETAAHEQGPSTSQDSKINGKRKAVSKIAKFRKKYLCWIPF